MAVIPVPDVHVSLHWKNTVAKRKPGDVVIFLGDYFDKRGDGPFARSQADNFREICAYARATPDTILLAGNHEYKYLPWADGFSERRTRKEREAAAALQENLDLLEMVAVAESGGRPVIFSHGGVTATFLRLHDLADPLEVNALWKARPEAFDWLPRNPEDPLERSDRSGDNPWQSPLWVRPDALAADGVSGFCQVVGHTVIKSPRLVERPAGDWLLLTCTLDDQFVRLEGNGFSGPL